MKKIFALSLFIFLASCTSETLVFFSGSEIEPIAGRSGEVIQLPEPEREGYGFFGWYLDESLSQAVETSFMLPDEDLTLYPEWKKVITIKFDDLRDNNELTGFEGEQLELPIPENFEGFVFENWYIDSSLSTPFLQERFGSEDVTLFAKFIPEIDYLINFFIEQYDARVVNLDEINPGFKTITFVKDNIAIDININPPRSIPSGLILTIFPDYKGSLVRVKLIYNFSAVVGVQASYQSRIAVFIGFPFEGVEGVNVEHLSGYQDSNFTAFVKSIVNNDLYPEFESLMDDAGINIRKLDLNN